MNTLVIAPEKLRRIAWQPTTGSGGRVLNWLAKDPTIRAAALKKRLEEEYHLQLSYYVAWDGRNMALE